MKLGAREASDSPLDGWPDDDMFSSEGVLTEVHTYESPACVTELHYLEVMFASQLLSFGMQTRRLQDLARQDAFSGSEPCHTATLSEAVTQYEDQLGVWVHDLNTRSEELESLLLRLNGREQLQEF